MQRRFVYSSLEAVSRSTFQDEKTMQKEAKNKQSEDCGEVGENGEKDYPAIELKRVQKYNSVQEKKKLPMDRRSASQCKRISADTRTMGDGLSLIRKTVQGSLTEQQLFFECLAELNDPENASYVMNYLRGIPQIKDKKEVLRKGDEGGRCAGVHAVR